MLAGAELAGAASLYNVAKVHVDVTAKDAVIAREKGMAEAETRAMEILLRRLVPLSSQASLPTFSHGEIEGLVAGIAIRSEKTSATRYIGVLDVRFYPGSVQQLLISRSIPFVDAPASAISILPVMLEGDGVAHDASADWRAAWERLDLENGVAPATLVAPREDLDARTVRAVLAGDVDAYAGLRSLYGYGGLVVAAGEIAGGFFRVRLAGEDAAGRVDAVVTSAVDASDRGATADAGAWVGHSSNGAGRRVSIRGTRKPPTGCSGAVHSTRTRSPRRTRRRSAPLTRSSSSSAQGTGSRFILGFSGWKGFATSR
ncbi:hypothetical protein [Methyloceanibacter methanicus]|uniref:hypothetical protein n=1 Tax=Methyloceanibacter methanicus TaxID=1774968 RepID=UPI00114D09C6|nr:hypothetical protein [Methyloceanibacter methanicus]